MSLFFDLQCVIARQLTLTDDKNRISELVNDLSLLDKTEPSKDDWHNPLAAKWGLASNSYLVWLAQPLPTEEGRPYKPEPSLDLECLALRFENAAKALREKHEQNKG